MALILSITKSMGSDLGERGLSVRQMISVMPDIISIMQAIKTLVCLHIIMMACQKDIPICKPMSHDYYNPHKVQRETFRERTAMT